MQHKQVFRYLILMSAAAFAIALATTWLPSKDARAQTGSTTTEPFTSPLPTPTPTSQVTSHEAQIVLTYLAAHHNLAREELQIVNEHQVTYPLIGRAFKAFTIWTQDPDPFHIKIQPVSQPFQSYNFSPTRATGIIPPIA